MNKLIIILILLFVFVSNIYGFINTNSFVNINSNRLKRIVPLVDIKTKNIVNIKRNNNIILNGISVSLDNALVPSTGVKLQKATLFIFLTYLIYRLLKKTIEGNIIIIIMFIIFVVINILKYIKQQIVIITHY